MSENYSVKKNVAGNFPPDGYVFDQYTKVQRGFIDKVRAEGIDEGIKFIGEAPGECDLSFPEKIYVCPEGESDSFVLEISENEDFSDSFIIECNTEGEIENLKNGQRYFWRVDGGETHWFITRDNEWRFINIDGLHNVRDVGGRGIKPGILYRGSEIMGVDFQISERGLHTLRDQLKVKTELDLRKEYVGRYTDSPPAPGVDLKQLPYRPYVEIFEDEHRKGIVKIMDLLSDESVYPVYFHCMGGADRTGMIALYLEALAGESEEDVFLDYELTSLSRIYNPQKGVSDNLHRSRKAPYFTEFLEELAKYAPGQGLAAQVRAFLLDSGVSGECIDKIVKIIKK